RLRCGRDVVVIENHREPRERSQRLAAHATGQINTAQIHGHRPNRADAIQAQLQLARRAQLLERRKIIEDARGRFTMGGPNPTQAEIALEVTTDFRVIERFAPANLMDLEGKALTRRVVDQTVAKFAIAEDETRRVKQ